MASAPGSPPKERPVPFSVTASGAASTVCSAAGRSTAICTAVYRLTGNTFLAQAADAFIVRPLRVALIVVLALVFIRLGRRVIRRVVHSLHGVHQRGTVTASDLDAIAVARRAQRAETIGALLRSIVTLVVWSIALLMALGQLGINIGPLVAGAGIVGVAIGFGAQNLVRDFLSGIFMLMEDQYGVGDIIDAGPATGTVENVGLRTTRIRDVNGVVWHIPNGQIQRIGNKSQQWSRALLDIDVSYATDIEEAKTVIKAVADGMWRDDAYSHKVLEEPEVWGVEQLGSDGISIRLVVKTTPADQYVVARELRARIKAAFDAEGIDFPVPQQVVWNRTEVA